MEKIALVTGATAGIGKETAIMLARNGYNLIITGRRVNRLEDLKNHLESQYNVKVFPLSFDISKRQEVENAWAQLPEQWKQIDVLINNAGLALGLDFIYEGNVDDWEQMIDTNIKGLLYISRLVMPIMKERRKGHIVNISSIAGKETYQRGNIYCATKHAVEAITKGMRIDLLPYNVKVSSVSPGMVETEFSIVRFKGDKEKAKNVYQGLEPLTAKDIADIIEFIITRPPHVNINDVLVMPTAQANSYYVYRQNS
jgi:hypothetical protein